jgi:hypothetical protein
VPFSLAILCMVVFLRVRSLRRRKISTSQERFEKPELSGIGLVERAELTVTGIHELNACNNPQELSLIMEGQPHELHSCIFSQ